MYRNRLEPLKPPRKGLHIGTRMLLFAAAAVFILQIFLYVMGGQDKLCVYFWLYPLLFALDIVLLVALLIPGMRRIAKTVMTRKILTALACIVTGFVAVVSWSVVWTFYSIGNQPIAYYTSPSGEHRLVIMRHYDIEESIEDPLPVYEAYPMVNAMYYMYQENGQLSSADVKDSSAVGEQQDGMAARTDSSVAVEWVDDAHARVYLPGVMDEEKEIHVRFNP